MAHNFETPQFLATAALAALHEVNILPSLLSRDYEADLTRRAIGDTVDIRIPGTFEAQTWTPGTEVTYQEVTETKVQVKLDTVHDVSFKANALENVQSIDNLNEQLMVPAMRALSTKIELSILEKLAAAATTEVGTGGQDARPYSYDNAKVLIDARVALQKALAPVADRYALVGADMAGSWLDGLSNFSQVGDLENVALREAALGRIQGFDVFETTNIAPAAEAPAAGEPTTEVGVAFQKGAAALAVGTLHNNNTNQAVVSEGGLSIRVTRAFNHALKEDLYSFDVLWGLNALRPEHIVLIKGADQA